MPSLVFIDVVESEYDGREITTLYGETIVVQMNMELDTVEIEGLKMLFWRNEELMLIKLKG